MIGAKLVHFLHTSHIFPLKAIMLFLKLFISILLMCDLDDFTPCSITCKFIVDVPNNQIHDTLMISYTLDVLVYYNIHVHTLCY